ncbi:S41 family peptidase [Flavobacterium caeni]|uniref:Peptidase family S41 n=1 Tax=Flavobacterium caeni TaxID=490189 RepID=A0A1G5HUI5_9FLAO|nr:S41 family peptidase [Flavobacterium caeni]SCY66688.1 Peptidase family S41 [Flavobacterium caeni]
MKNWIVLLCLASTAIALGQKSQNRFKSEVDLGHGSVFSTFFESTIADGKFTITSPKNADVRIMGGKARLGRIIGKSPKKGIIVSIEGMVRNDSLFGQTKIPMFGKLFFKGIITDQQLQGVLIDEDGEPVGKVTGTQSTAHKIDYASLCPELLQTIKDNIYAARVLETSQWKEFETNLKRHCDESVDDIELFFGFNTLAQKLPFTHLTLQIAEIAKEEEPTDAKGSVVVEEKNATTAYVQIKNFSTSKQQLAEAMPKVVANRNYDNLIIDLRNNGGGGINAAFELAKYIVSEDIEVGYFVSNKLQYSGFDQALFNTLPAVQPKSTAAFGDDLRTKPGLRMIFRKPDNPIFKGQIYVLTNGRTASTCEPIVYALKKNKKATIIGETTYGGMLAASPFAVSGKYVVMVPIGDFYTADGVRLDKVGVTPDIATKSDDALAKALELINNHKK